MPIRISLLCPVLLVVGALAASPRAVAAEWRAGVARANITPEQLMWMSGYGARNRPAEGKLTDLWAKVIVLEGPNGAQVVAVTLDLVGIDRPTGRAIREGIERQHLIPLENVALFCSHTHTGPVVGNNLRSMFELSEDEGRKIDDYTAWLVDEVVAAAGRAKADLEPVRLSWACGTATYAVNRRNNREADVPMLREKGLLQGPVDHDVPVLAVRAGDRLKAVLFGYACHATVLDSYEWTGDHPGFAMLALEERYPGTQAMFWAGCGADQNPLPRRTVELARKYGQMLAQAVTDVLNGAMRTVSGELRTTYAEIDLPFASLPTRDQLEQTTASDNRFERIRARLLLEQWDVSGGLSAAYPYPVQTWKLGDGPLWVTLGGEVVVDYSLRLKEELGPERTWVAGYTNDVMAYIPSLRVLMEGGYEGGGAMLYYGLPSAWAEDVEDRIVGEAHRQALAVQSAR